MDESTIVMTMDDGSKKKFTIIDSTILGGKGYILVTENPEDEDGECFIMKDVSEPEDEEAVYEDVDGEEAEAVWKVFEEQLAEEFDFEH